METFQERPLGSPISPPCGRTKSGLRKGYHGAAQQMHVKEVTFSVARLDQALYDVENKGEECLQPTAPCWISIAHASRGK